MPGAIANSLKPRLSTLVTDPAASTAARFQHHSPTQAQPALPVTLATSQSEPIRPQSPNFPADGLGEILLAVLIATPFLLYVIRRELRSP